jgi:DNA gyrase subunit B
VDNSVDEALAGQADTIDVTLLADGGVRVSDNGRGIPVAMHPTEGRPTVEVVMTILHAGGKFGGGGYAVSGGLHGVGISVVNALSRRVVTEVRRDGYAWRQEFADGGTPVTELERLEPTEETGTTQTFWPDDSIFETTEFDFETLRSRFQQYAFLNKGLKIAMTDERAGHAVDVDEVTGRTAGTGGESTAMDGQKSSGAPSPGTGARTVTYKYDNGLMDYVAHLNSAKKVELVHPEIVHFEAEDTERRISVEVAMQWTNAYSESVHTYANTIATTEGGTHEEGFRAAMTYLVNSYAREKGIIKEKEENLTGDDIRDEARQHRGQDVRPARGARAAHRLVRLAPRRGQGRHPEGHPGLAGTYRGPQGARGDPPQGSAQQRRHAGQAQGLPVQPPGGVRGLHRRG